MTERKLLELAPGSRWVNNGELLCGEIEITEPGKVRLILRDSLLISIDEYWDSGEQRAAVEAKNAIALLHRAGLLDGLLAEAWDEGHDAGAAYVRSWGSSLQKNPYRKAGENV